MLDSKITKENKFNTYELCRLERILMPEDTGK